MNAGELILWMQNKAPSAVLKPGWTWYRVLNKAGIDFYNAHDWQFAERTTANVTGTAGSGRFELPADFVSYVSVESSDLGRDQIEVVSSAVMNQRESENLRGTGSFWSVCFDDAQDQQTPAEFIRPTARIYPKPTTTGSPRMLLTYERGWREIPEGAAGHVPNIRKHCLSVFMDFCELAAWEALFDTTPPHMDLKAARLAALIEKDEQATPSVPVRGGIDRRPNDDFMFSNDLTTD